MDDPPDRAENSKELFERFLRYEKLGMRNEAKKSALDLVASVCGSNSEETWTRDNLHQLPLNGAGRIRHEIFQYIVFPSLKAAMEQVDPEASYLLGKYVQNLYSDDTLWKQVGYRSKTELFREAYDASPNSPRYRGAYLAAVLADLGYTFHEWPSGILIEHANWRQELRDLRGQISLAMSLDLNGENASLLAEWLEITDQYEKQLAAKEGCQ